MEIIKRIIRIMFYFCLIFFVSCKEDKTEIKHLEEDFTLPKCVKVKYEVFFQDSVNYNMEVSFRDSTYYDFKQNTYIGTEKYEHVILKECSYFEHEFLAYRGAILELAANLISKEGKNSKKVQRICTRIYIDNVLIKENIDDVYSNCKYIYGTIENDIGLI